MAELLTAEEVRERLRAAVAEAGSERAWAAANGMSNQYVNQVLTGRTTPSDNISRALGLRRAVVWVPVNSVLDGKANAA